MMEKKPMLLAFLLHSLAVITFLSLSSCSSDPNQINCAVVPATTQPSEPVTCNDSALTGYDELVIITPHPDDEVLGFAGLMLEFIRLNKPVSIRCDQRRCILRCVCLLEKCRNIADNGAMGTVR